MEFDQKLNNLEIKVNVNEQTKEIKINSIVYNFDMIRRFFLY